MLPIRLEVGFLEDIPGGNGVTAGAPPGYPPPCAGQAEAASNISCFATASTPGKFSGTCSPATAASRRHCFSPSPVEAYSLPPRWPEPWPSRSTSFPSASSAHPASPSSPWEPSPSAASSSCTRMPSPRCTSPRKPSTTPSPASTRSFSAASAPTAATGYHLSSPDRPSSSSTTALPPVTPCWQPSAPFGSNTRLASSAPPQPCSIPGHLKYRLTHHQGARRHLSPQPHA